MEDEDEDEEDEAEGASGCHGEGSLVGMRTEIRRWLERWAADETAERCEVDDKNTAREGNDSTSTRSGVLECIVRSIGAILVGQLER